MKFRRYFFDSSINFAEISKVKVVIGIIIGLVSTLTIYSFFYLFRESLKAVSFVASSSYLPVILSDSARSFQNLFFAGLSVVLANSFVVLYLFSRPNSLLNRKNLKRNRVFNDQTFTSFNFFYLLFKVCFLLGFMWTCCFEFTLSRSFEFFAFLLVFVLYLESWKNLSLILKKNRLKIQFLHFILLLGLTFLVSKIEVVDYKIIDAVILESNPIYNLPHSNFYNVKNDNRFYDFNLKLELNQNNQLRIKYYDKFIHLEDIKKTIYIERASMREELVPYLRVRLLADKDLELKYIKMVEAQLFAANQFRIIYGVYNDDILSSRFESRGLKYRIVRPVYDFRISNSTPVSPVSPISLKEYLFKDTLRISINDKIKVNGSEVSKNILTDKFKNYVNAETLFLYEISNKTKYQDYITVLSSHIKSAYELRELEKTVFNENDYYEQYKKEQFELIERYPIYLIERLN